VKNSSVRLFALFAVVFCALASFGQVLTGLPPMATFQKIGPLTINVSDLNAHLTIPIISKAGRGTPFNYALTYDNTFWAAATTGSQSWWETNDAICSSPCISPSTYGWQPQGTAVTGYIEYQVYGATTCFGFQAFIYHDPSGTPHEFGFSSVSEPSCNVGHTSFTRTANDGSGIGISVNLTNSALTAVIHPRGGGVITPPLVPSVGFTQAPPPAPQPSPQPNTGPFTVTDANGNTITITKSGSRTVFTDTLATTVLTIDQPNGGPDSYTYTGSDGNPATIKVNYQPQTVTTCFQAPDPRVPGAMVTEYTPRTVPLISDIDYSDGSQYSLTYEPTSSGPNCSSGVTARLQSVTLPTGGTITLKYSGGSNGILVDGTAPTLSLTTVDGTQTYSRNDWWLHCTDTGCPNSTTTVSDATPAHNQTVYTFHNNYETDRQAYKGAASGGTVLAATVTCYNGNTSGCDHDNSFNPPFVQKLVFTLSGSHWKQQNTNYDAETTLPVEIDESDWSVGAVQPPVLRKTTIVYAPLGNNIVDRPLTVTVSDGNNHQISKTTYGYDEGQVTPTTGLRQHTAVTGSRGNLTSVHQWLGTTGGTLDTLATYDDAGNMLSTTDPNKFTTSFVYGDCNGAFVTKTILPDTNLPDATLVHHSISSKYDCNLGLAKTVTDDQNQQTTTFHYDNSWRPTETDYPDGGQTNISYDSPTQVHTQSKIDSSHTADSYVQVDGMGRTSRTAVTNGESTPYDQQDLCYDATGRLAFRSYPYQSSGLSTTQVCSGAGDGIFYDTLGRTAAVVHSDGSSVQYSYTDRATQITDEGNGSSNVSRISQTDGLGRLTSVCEVSNTTLSGDSGTPKACGQDIPATGFLTTYGYSYDSNGNLTTTINQGGVFPRTFVNDSLGRLTSESEPEWIATGQTTPSTAAYSYDNDGQLIQRTRPQVNQTNPAVTTATHYVYDALGRLAQRWYSDTTAPNAYFNYDETMPYGITVNNPAGRLTSEYNNAATRSVFSYDSMGRIQHNWQCSPRTCGKSWYPLDYQYDLAGDMTSASDGLTTTYNYGYNAVGRFNGLTSTLSDANHPGTLLSNVHYGAFGVVNDVLGNGVVENVKYSPRGAVSSRTAQSLGNSAASGSVVIAGSERVKQLPAGTPGQGSVTIHGAVQSTQVQTQAATQSTDRISVYGAEQWAYPCIDWLPYSDPPDCDQWSKSAQWDSGGVTVYINGNGYGGGYGQGSTAASVAADAVNTINASAGNVVTASSVAVSQYESDIILRSKSYGSSTNYPLAYGYSSNDSADFGDGSFSISGDNQMSGGQDAAYTTVFDAGSCTITTNNHGNAQSWSGSGATAASIAQGLCSSINADTGAYVTASTNGIAGQCPLNSTTISLIAKTPGATTNYSLSSSCSYDSSHFSTPSFTAANSGSTLTGGTGPGTGTVYDSGTVTVTVNGFSKTIPYGAATVDVRFTNDSCSGCGNGTPQGGGDRNLYINSITIGSTTILPNDPSVSYTAAPCNSYTNGVGALLCNGDLMFTTGAAGQTITVSAYGSSDYNIHPHMQLLVDGVMVGEWDVTDTTQNYTAAISTENNTAQSVASALAAALSSDPSSPVTASPSGATLNLRTVTGTAGINFSLSASSATNSPYFTGSSFTVTPSGATLTGGTGSNLHSYALATAPDGNIATANDSVNGNWAYSHDEFNRLSGASKNAGQQTFAYIYDRYGNRLQQLAPQGGPSPQYTFDNFNHITGSGITYDALGNVTNDGFHSYTYDAEGRLLQVDGGNTAKYVYDAEGRRITGPGSEYVYDLAGHPISQINPSLNPPGVSYSEIYTPAGRHLATYSGGTTNFLHSDWLGTKRATSNVTGSLSETCTSLPFGDGLNCTGTDSSLFHFTDDIHDLETNLEHTLFRKYSTTQGRWMTTDPYRGSMDFSNPQSLNRYAYVADNPASFKDTKGLSSNSTECYIDNQPYPCEVADDFTNGGATVQCPDNNCDGLRAMQDGTIERLQWVAPFTVTYQTDEHPFDDPNLEGTFRIEQHGGDYEWVTVGSFNTNEHVGMDVWHCDPSGKYGTCENTWQLAFDTVEQPAEKFASTTIKAAMVGFAKGCMFSSSVAGGKVGCLIGGSIEAAASIPDAAAVGLVHAYIILWRNVFFGPKDRLFPGVF